jgi:hypothetical protein
MGESTIQLSQICEKFNKTVWLIVKQLFSLYVSEKSFLLLISMNFRMDTEILGFQFVI